MTLTEAKACVKMFGRSELAEALDRWDDERILLAALDCDVVEIMETYEGEHDSDALFVQQMLEDCTPELGELPHYIHIDWEATAKDTMTDYCTSDGHYFRMQ